jgi:precorrin-6B methylase 2
VRPPRRLLLGAGAAAAVGVGAFAARKVRGGVVRTLSPQPGERLVGAGAWAGAIAPKVADRLWPGGELALVDAPDSAADAAHAQGLESVTLVDQSSFEDGSFDGAYVLGPTDFAELKRVLRPGARLVVGHRVLVAAAEAAGFTREKGNLLRNHE